MAHVLMPCDLPTWNDIQTHLAQLKACKDAEELVQSMAKIFDICSISLDPDEAEQKTKPNYFEPLKKFIEESMASDDRVRFFSDTLPHMVSQALCLRLVKPHPGFLYSLKNEDDSFQLERPFVTSLLANAFFSTFPRRSQKTHPTLQNFSFAEFFQHLSHRSQQKKLRAFLRYFETQEERQKGFVCFTRKVLSDTGLPTLPGWLCSDRPLVPLIVRHDGSVHDAEPQVFRVCYCSPLIGGDVLQTANSQESSLFFAFPELLSCLSFVECLEDNEALIIQGVDTHGILQYRQGTGHDMNLCLMDGIDFSLNPNLQFEDRFLLREFNKALATFSKLPQPLTNNNQRRQTPVGESSSSEQPSTSSSRKQSTSSTTHRKNSDSGIKMYRTESQEKDVSKYHEGKRPAHDRLVEQKKASILPPIRRTASSDLAPESHPRRNSGHTNSGHKVRDWPKLPGQQPLSAPCNTASSSNVMPALKTSRSSSHSSTRSMKTASQSSLELPPIQATPQGRLGEDESYYTADEDSEEGSEYSGNANHRRRSSNHQEQRLPLVMPTSRLVEVPQRLTKKNTKDTFSRDSSSDFSRSSSRRGSRRSDSMGFVLGGASDEENEEIEAEEDYDLNQHERLEDFRKRIRRRTRRHLSRKSSRGSYSLGSSGSSDMEDISEDPEIPSTFSQCRVIRPASSEPSLISLLDEGETAVVGMPPLSLSPDTVILSLGGRKMMVTSSSGQLKAYSYDGVSPNLPVPFKAKFRRRRHHSEEDGGNRRDVSWSSLEMGIGHSTGITSSDEDCSNPTSSSRFSSYDVYNPIREVVGSTGSRTEMQRYESDEGCKRQEKRCAAAAGPPRGEGTGDRQLRALILWVAASMAGLPSLIFYTAREPVLNEMSTVYRTVLSRQWSVGDLSCEILRFCRNRISSRRRMGVSQGLFQQLLSSGAYDVSSSISSCSHSQPSLE